MHNSAYWFRWFAKPSLKIFRPKRKERTRLWVKKCGDRFLRYLWQHWEITMKDDIACPFAINLQTIISRIYHWPHHLFTNFSFCHPFSQTCAKLSNFSFADLNHRLFGYTFPSQNKQQNWPILANNHSYSKISTQMIENRILSYLFVASSENW